MTSTNAKLVDIINALLQEDTYLDDHDVSVNLTMDDKIIAYWAKRPSRRQSSRYKEIVSEARDRLGEEINE